MGIIVNIIILYVIFWGLGKILKPLFDYGEGGPEYYGQLVGWFMAITFFLFLFGIL